MSEWGNPLRKQYPVYRKRTGRSETSQYPEEKKSTEISLVVANEREEAQNLDMWQLNQLGS